MADRAQKKWCTYCRGYVYHEVSECWYRESGPVSGLEIAAVAAAAATVDAAAAGDAVALSREAGARLAGTRRQRGARVAALRELFEAVPAVGPRGAGRPAVEPAGTAAAAGPPGHLARGRAAARQAAARAAEEVS